VLILGAGYDSRAYRFRTSIAARPVFEVDLAPLSRRKAKIVAARPDLFGSSTIRRVEIDFRTQSLADQLAGAGFTSGAPTFVAWEGVSMYLTWEAIAATLDVLATGCGPGSVLAMDFWQQVGGLRPVDTLRRVGQRAIRVIGEPIMFSARPATVTRSLDAAGFVVADLVTADDMTARYATAERHCDPGMYVLAARRR
jgi:methyltransferase (TIGR00027 family)